MTEASKKNFETNRENNKIRRQSEREAWLKTKKKKSFFKLKTHLCLIFVFFTTHFRIHHLRFTAFFIHERWSFSMNFKKNHTKNSTWIPNRSKWSSSRSVMRRTSISRMKDAWFFAWKKTFTIVNDNRHLHDVFSSRMRTRNVIFFLNDWIKRFIIKEKFKESSEQFIRKRNSIKKCFSNSMNSLFNYWNNNF
jgi:hypothetical protein